MMANKRAAKPASTDVSQTQAAAEIRRKAEGQAAMMMLESVLLALLDRAVLSKSDVLEAIEIVVETKKNIAAEGTSVEVEHAAEGLLVKLANSLMASTSPRKLNGPV